MEYHSYSYEFVQENPWSGYVALVLLIVAVIGCWKLFEKAGVPGWHAIIPFLNTYDLCIISLAESVGLWTVLNILLPVTRIYTDIKLAKAFGKGTGFGVLTFFFTWIGLPILGLGSAEYEGVR